MRLKALVGSGDKIAFFSLPFAAAGVAANTCFPAVFGAVRPSRALTAVSVVFLLLGIAIWLWSAILILSKVPKKELITGGPYSLVKHPLYTGVALLVLPWAGFLLHTWLGAWIGIGIYLGSRVFSPREEKDLAERFGPAWEDYCQRVKLPWL